jgi:phosphoribosylanthranilate isomerase
MFVKICGLTDRAAVEAAVEAGADALGFVFAESAREIAPKAALALCRGLPAGIRRVAVMHHPSRARFLDVLETFDPDWIQTDAADFDTLPAPARARPLPVYRDGETGAIESWPRRLLFEGRVSGSGSTADWDEAKASARHAELILAGGLDAENVQAAVEYVRPFGVDVSSGVEYARGKKDPRKVTEFIARVRALENES